MQSYPLKCYRDQSNFWGYSANPSALTGNHWYSCFEMWQNLRLYWTWHFYLIKGTLWWALWKFKACFFLSQKPFYVMCATCVFTPNKIKALSFVIMVMLRESDITVLQIFAFFCLILSIQNTEIISHLSSLLSELKKRSNACGVSLQFDAIGGWNCPLWLWFEILASGSLFLAFSEKKRTILAHTYIRFITKPSELPIYTAF